MTSSSLIAELPAPARSDSTSQTLATVRVLGAAGLLIGVFLAYLGFAWDVQDPTHREFNRLKQVP